MSIDVSLCFRLVQSKRELHPHSLEWQGVKAGHRCRDCLRSECLHQSRRWLQMRKPEKKLPLSDTSFNHKERRGPCIGTYLRPLNNWGRWMSVAVHESTENSDVAQLCLMIDYLIANGFREDLLGLIVLEGYMTGEIMFVSFFEDNNLDLEHIMLITDGAWLLGWWLWLQSGDNYIALFTKAYCMPN